MKEPRPEDYLTEDDYEAAVRCPALPRSTNLTRHMKRYFVTSINRSPDAGVMEQDICSLAKRIYTNVIVDADKLHKIVDYLKLQQDIILAQKPRRKPVSIGFTENHIVPGAMVNIGSSAINLVLVQGEIQ